MEEPVTDIKFVSSVDNCPVGYSIVRTQQSHALTLTPLLSFTLFFHNLFVFLQVTKCPCDHDAQLWEKVIGGEAGTRYICFVKDNTVSVGLLKIHFGSSVVTVLLCQI